MSDRKRAGDRPATFREVFSDREFRALHAAAILSWLGDNVARAAVTAMVYMEYHSALNSAATFAISYLPTVAGGPLLAALAERYPSRRVMIVCDLIRMVVISFVAIPHLPLVAVLLLLFGTALFGPPFDASRAAMLPVLLRGERVVMGIAIQTTTNQITTVVGYLGGAALAATRPSLALLIDGATFGLSALLIGVGLHARPAVRRPRRHLLAEVGAGVKVVFGTPLLRAIALVVLASWTFAAVPEALAAAWAGVLAHSAPHIGTAQGIIMTGVPAGYFVAGVLVTRLVPPGVRVRLLNPVAVLIPLCLVPALLSPKALVVAALAGACGLGIGTVMPTANGIFVNAIPPAFRVRAFSVMQSGLALVQGAGVMITGAAAIRLGVPATVGIWGLVGVVVLIGIAILWPARPAPGTTVVDAVDFTTAVPGVMPVTTTELVPLTSTEARAAADIVPAARASVEDAEVVDTSHRGDGRAYPGWAAETAEAH